MGDPEDLNGQEPEQPKSIRDYVEEAWDEVQDAADQEDAEEPSGQARDPATGRFVSKGTETGEQTDAVPAPDAEPPAGEDHPAPQGRSSGAPQHWSAEDRASFDRQTPEAQEFLLRRHAAMERDYTEKTQAAATAVQFTQTLAPIFQHPDMQRSMVDYQTGQPVHPAEAIRQWSEFHLRAMHPDPNVRWGLLRELATRMRLDPAVDGQASRQPAVPANIPPEVANSPAFKYLTDQLSSALGSVHHLQSELSEFRSAGERQRLQNDYEQARSGIYAFADETDAQGNRLRPDFDEVILQIHDLVRANPQVSIRDAYETARWMNPVTRARLLAQGQQSQQSQQSVQRAQAAVRSNVRGSNSTAPVGRPKADNGQRRSLHDVIMETAQEVGFE